MKKSLLLFLNFYFVLSAILSAQDNIFLTNGQQIKAIVHEINPEYVKFYRFENADGPLYSMPKKEVLRIQYKDGKIEEISKGNNSPNIHSGIEERLHYGGPRIGLTYLGPGHANDLIEDAFNRTHINSIATQFGWQFETRFFTLENGSSGLIELVPMIGGLEQGLFLPSISGLVGFRTQKGRELGMGPILSFGGVGVILAAGTSLKYGNVVFPINLAFLPSYRTDVTEDVVINENPYQVQTIKTRRSTGFRFTLTIGFNSRTK